MVGRCFAGYLRIALLLALVRCAGAAERSVVVGISAWVGDPHIAVPKYSDKDAGIVGKWLSTLSPNSVVELQNQSASLDRMFLELRQALLGAKPGDTVYIFLSGRGIALPGWKDGYIGTFRMVENKPQSTGIAVSDFASLVENSRAAAVYVLADLCREPQDNRINERLKGRLSQIAATQVRGILASTGEDTSREDEALKLGVFAYSLVNKAGNPAAIRSASGFERLFGSVQRAVSGQTAGAQRPSEFVSKSQRTAVLDTWTMQPVLLASLLRPAGLGLLFQAAVQAPASDPLELAGLLGAIAENRFDAPLQRLQMLRRSEPDEVWSVLRDRVVAALADSGQGVIAQYGTSDLLPDEPGKLQETDFVHAGEAFRAAQSALALRPFSEEERRIYAGYEDSLKSRELFCEGRAAAFYPDQIQSARSRLLQAAQASPRPIPEISNALGITYLENLGVDPKVRAQDLAQAARYFEESIQLSPTWPYPRHNLALVHIELGDATAAERAYRDAIAIRPHLPYLAYNLGLVQHRANELKDAERSYRVALAMSREMETDLQHRAGDWATLLPKASHLAALRVQAFRRNRAEILNAMGALAETRKKWTEAEESYREALDLNPQNCAARQNLAMLARHNGAKLRRPADSAALTEENTRECPAFKPSWMLLASIAKERGDADRARDAYRHVLRLSDQDVDALTGLGSLEEKAGNTNEAAALFARALRAYESRPGETSASAPLAVYLAVARTQEKLGKPAVCDFYGRARTALRVMPHSREEERDVRERMRQACSQPGRTHE